MLPAEAHIKYIFSLIYMCHGEQKNVYNLSAKLCLWQINTRQTGFEACFDGKPKSRDCCA